MSRAEPNSGCTRQLPGSVEREATRCLCTTYPRRLRRCNDLYSVRPMFATGKRAERGVRVPGAPVQAALQPSLHRDERGVVVVEYVLVLLLVCAGAGGALVLLGIALARFFAAQEAW